MSDNKTYTRAIHIPIATVNDMEWPEFNRRLHDSWRRGTILANWCIQTLFANDSPRSMESGKFVGKRPKTYLYGMRDIATEFAGCATSANSIIRAVESSYKKYRKDTYYKPFDVRLPDFRYPYPWRVHNQSWTIKEESERLILSFPLIGGRVSVVLAGGGRYARQRAAVLRLIRGELKKGELSIFRKGKKIIASMVLTFPQDRTEKDRSGTLYASMTPDSFIVAVNESSDRLFVINGDRIKRQIAKHHAALDRGREDRKFDTVRDKRAKRFDDNHRKQQSEKQRNRIKSFVMESAANIVNHANRRRLARIVLNDSCREYFGTSFPYYQFTERIGQLCNELGITFEIAGECSSDEKIADTSRVSA